MAMTKLMRVYNFSSLTTTFVTPLPGPSVIIISMDIHQNGWSEVTIKLKGARKN